MGEVRSGSKVEALRLVMGQEDSAMAMVLSTMPLLVTNRF